MPLLRGLRQAREAKLLSQQELAEKAGVHKTTIYRLETGDVEAQYRTIRKLAAALEEDPATLIGERTEERAAS